MNINDFKFYRINNRYYFESDLLEGRVYIIWDFVYDAIIENGEDTLENISELLHLFNENIAAVLAAEEV